MRKRLPPSSWSHNLLKSRVRRRAACLPPLHMGRRRCGPSPLDLLLPLRKPLKGSFCTDPAGLIGPYEAWLKLTQSQIMRAPSELPKPSTASSITGRGQRQPGRGAAVASVGVLSHASCSSDAGPRSQPKRWDHGRQSLRSRHISIDFQAIYHGGWAPAWAVRTQSAPWTHRDDMSTSDPSFVTSALGP